MNNSNKSSKVIVVLQVYEKGSHVRNFSPVDLSELEVAAFSTGSSEVFDASARRYEKVSDTTFMYPHPIGSKVADVRRFIEYKWNQNSQ